MKDLKKQLKQQTVKLKDFVVSMDPDSIEPSLRIQLRDLLLECCDLYEAAITALDE